MTDIRPPLDLSDERTTLVAYLDYLRDAIVRKVQGLDESAVRRPMVPSGTSLLGLVDHLLNVERYWFHHVFAGRDVPMTPPGTPLAEDLTADSAIAQYRETTAGANEIVTEAADLEQGAARDTFDGRRPTLRWVLVHMIEETGRHAGHADIIRELIDGETGR